MATASRARARRARGGSPTSAGGRSRPTSACVMDGNGRWAGRRGPAPHRGPRVPVRPRCSMRSRGPSSWHPLAHHVRLLDRELAPPGRRGPLPDGLQRGPPGPAPRRAARERGADPLRRAPRLAGPKRVLRRMDESAGADPAEPADDPHHGLQLRWPGRDRRRGPPDVVDRVPAEQGRREGHHARGSTSPTSPTPTWSSGPRGSTGSPTSCSGSWPTASWCSPTCCGPISAARISSMQCASTSSDSGGTAG